MLRSGGVRGSAPGTRKGKRVRTPRGSEIHDPRLGTFGQEAACGCPAAASSLRQVAELGDPGSEEAIRVWVVVARAKLHP